MPKATVAQPNGVLQPPSSYEAALAELEQLLGQLEAGQLPLDQLLGSYQRGAVLLAYCKERLAAVEQQIQMLDDVSGKPVQAEPAL